MWQQLYQITRRVRPYKKGFINIQNIYDNECFKWCLVRYIHHAEHTPESIREVGKDFAREIDFQNIKFSVKIRDIHKVEKNNCININVFGYENKEKYPIHVSKIFSIDILIYC